MVTRASFFSASLAVGLLLTAGCKTVEPVTVYASFTTSPALAVAAPSNIAVLPVENGTGNPATDRHLVFLRQELGRQMVTRYYAAPQAQWVDASLRELEAAAPKPASVLDPTWLSQAAAAAAVRDDDAVFALRIDRWDESQLLINRRVFFQFQAALVGKEGRQLWYGTLSGDIKAGGAGAAPRDREYMARSCLDLAIRELLLRLPERPRR